ncbi:formylmethanofuran dehydrogenase subunit E [Thermodesulfovibrio aggregans]|uniref:Formylmethanofuran dehydrogenase subunit E n=1 Tax=Thermodesulfovibrio aggregans TaxID=86166 RepID=A0A0U9HP38_9BACT|nr:FmdE family protein [Thermodesulfovibrio aggregans]GAQ94816.1 formylmethanofuran dehydrogenase subunit E [Thermodesulfovibrio aggregans]
MKFEDVIKFHGHSCPGLAMGYVVAKAALEELGIKDRSQDEEIVCIVENDSCAVDAIQVMVGCTFGKGNLIFRDYGKQVYTFFNRKTGRAVRISVDFESKETEEEKKLWQRFMEGDRSPEVLEFVKKRKAEKINKILNAKKEEILKITYPQIKTPKEARVFKSLRCEICGEKVAEVRARILDGKILCIPCFEESL